MNGTDLALGHIITEPRERDAIHIAVAPVVAHEQLYARRLGVESWELIQHATEYAMDGEYWTQGGRFEGWSLDDEFWPHFEIATGTAVSESERGSFFSCSC